MTERDFRKEFNDKVSPAWEPCSCDGATGESDDIKYEWVEELLSALESERNDKKIIHDDLINEVNIRSIEILKLKIQLEAKDKENEELKSQVDKLKRQLDESFWG